MFFAEHLLIWNKTARAFCARFGLGDFGWGFCGVHWRNLSKRSCDPFIIKWLNGLVTIKLHITVCMHVLICNIPNYYIILVVK